VSKQDVDKFQAVADQASANLQAAQAALAQNQLNLTWTKVTAPVDGRISRYFVTVGNLITQDQTVLTTIVSTGRIYAYFDMDDTTVLRVRQLAREAKAKFGQEGAGAPVYLRLENEKGFPHQGQINFEDNTITPRTGTLRVRGVFANQDGALQPGYFVRLRVPIGTPHQALLVPDRAIDNERGIAARGCVGCRRGAARLARSSTARADHTAGGRDLGPNGGVQFRRGRR